MLLFQLSHSVILARCLLYHSGCTSTFAPLLTSIFNEVLHPLSLSMSLGSHSLLGWRLSHPTHSVHSILDCGPAIWHRADAIGGFLFTSRVMVAKEVYT